MVWENAYIPFFHAAMDRNENFKVSSMFMVRVSTMLAAKVFSEAEKHWLISTITMYGKALHKDEEVEHMFKIPYKFGQYFSLVGADRSEMTATER